MLAKPLAVALFFTLQSPFLSAETKPSQHYVVSVHGIVCELCSYGVAKKIRKLPFIDSTQFDKGVKVDIKNQRVFIATKSDATLDKTALFKAIESGGYKPIEISTTLQNQTEEEP